MIVSGNSVTYQGAIFKSQFEAYFPSGVPSPSPTPAGSGVTGSGSVNLGSTIPSGDTATYTVDGKPVSSALNTTNLSDGQHTVVAQITQPNGQVVTEEQTLTVDNHKTVLDNAILRYGMPTVVSTILVMGTAVAGIVGYTIHRIRRRAAGHDVNGPALLVSPTDGPINLPPAPFL